MLKHNLLLLIITSLFTLLGNPAVGMELPLICREQTNYSFPNVQKIDKDFYVGRMRSQADKDLWLVMEHVSADNHRTWCQYIDVQCNPRAVEYVSAMVDENGKSCQKGSTGDGSYHFRKVLEEVSYDHNEIWVAYITKAEKPQKIRDGLLCYTNQHLDRSSNSFAKDIEMFVTVTSSPQALITSHMGIASSIEGAGIRQKGTSLDLHSFAAKVMLMRNPARRFMVNAPVFAMEKIIANALPDSTFVGTREMRERMQKVQGIGFREFVALKGNTIKEKIRNEAIEEALANNSRLERDISLLHEGKIEGETEESLRQKANRYLFLVKMDSKGNFIVSEEEIELRHQVELNEEFLYFKNPHYFRPAKSRETAAVEFLKFMEKCPPLLSITRDHGKKSFTIFDPETPETPWLTIDGSNEKDYNWMFKDPFLPAGLTHYMVVDLVALAHSKPLNDIDSQLWKKIGNSLSICANF